MPIFNPIDDCSNFGKGQVPSIYGVSDTVIALDAIIAGIGQVITNGTITLVGVGTTFLNTFKPGDTITVQGETIRTIASVGTDTVLTVTSPFVTTTTNLAYVVGGGSRFLDPAVDGQYNCVWWDQKTYPDPDDDPNREIVRVTAKVGDTFTILRAQEDTLATTKNTFGGLYSFSNVFTKYVLDEIRSQIGYYKYVANYGSLKPQEVVLNFNDYFTLTDDPINHFTNVVIDTSGLSSDVTLLTNISNSSLLLSNVINNIITAGAFVQSVEDDGGGVVSVDNSDPVNPIIVFNGVETDGVTMTGNGKVGNPLVSLGGGTGGSAIFKNGIAIKESADASVVQLIPHGMGVVPGQVKITASLVQSGSSALVSKTTYNGVTQSSNSYYGLSTGNPAADDDFFRLSTGDPVFDYQTGVVTFDATNIIITWTRTGTPPGGIYILLWEAESSTGGGGGGTSFSITISQPGHTLTPGNVLKMTGPDTFGLAQADSQVNAEVVGIVTSIVPGVSFTYTSSAIQLPSAMIGVEGSAIFLDPVIPGMLTTVKPTTPTQIVRALGTIISSGSLIYFDCSGLAKQL